MMARLSALSVLMVLAACAPDPPPPAADATLRPTPDPSSWQRAPTPSTAAMRGTGPALGGGTMTLQPPRNSSPARRSNL